MSGFEEQPGGARQQIPSGVGLLGSLVALGFGIRIATASGRTSWMRCLSDGSCDGLVDAVLSHPGNALLSASIVGASAVPLALWSRRARRDPAWLDEVSDVVRKIVGYFAAAFAVMIGTFVALGTDAWWTLAVSVGLWIVGFAIVTVAFRRSRLARTLYVVALILFPMLIRGFEGI